MSRNQMLAPVPMPRVRWILLASQVGCGGGGTGPGGGGAVTSVTITPPAGLTLIVGGAGTLTATARDAAGSALSGITFVWGALDSAIATVSGTGLVTRQNTGSTQVIASANGKADTVTIVVVAGACGGVGNVAEWDAILDFQYDDDTTTVGGYVSAGYHADVTATLLPAVSQDGRLEWTGELVVGLNHEGQHTSHPILMVETSIDTVSDPTERAGG